MTVTSRSRIGTSLLPRQSNDAVVQKPRSLTKRLDAYMRNYENGFDRISRIRQNVLNKSGHTHRFDTSLSNPELYRNPGIRALIHLAKYLDELAESCADISGVTERLTRNLISAGNKPDMSLIIASAVGRLVSGQLYCSGIAVHKVAGAGLYALSSLLSVVAVALTSSKYVRIRSEAEIKRARQLSGFDTSGHLFVARGLLKTKEALLHSPLFGFSNSNGETKKDPSALVKRLSRQYSEEDPRFAILRKTNSNYMWQNLHQYGPVTRALMHAAYGTFQAINKLGVSFDKHLGTLIGNKLFKKQAGEVLGCRLALTLSISLSAALSVPMAPLAFGLSTIGVVACGVAFGAILLAKMNVRYSGDWKGNILPPPRRQVFGSVTPT